MFGFDPLTAESRPWYKGAVGEIAVARVLARLGPEWTVLHAVPVGAGTSDIDHVLIGPAGVFTLRTDGQLLNWLNRRTPVLTQEQLARLVAVAPLPGTWHRKPEAPGDAVALHRGFDALRTEVVVARRRRAVWALAVAACFVVAVLKLPVIIAWVLPMLMHR